VIAQLAREQHGVVARSQLEQAGVTSRQIKTRVGDGRLVRLHRGVYAVGHNRLRSEGRWLAAVLACGPGALLSHRSAAALHGLRPATAGAVEVSTVWHRASADGLRVHGRRRLAPEDRDVALGVPVTSVARTLVDLADVLRPEQLRSALVRVEDQRSADVRAIEQALARVRGRPGRGHAALRAALDELRERRGGRTRSDLEELFLALVARTGLPRPRTNVWMPADALTATGAAPRGAVGGGGGSTPRATGVGAGGGVEVDALPRATGVGAGGGVEVDALWRPTGVGAGGGVEVDALWREERVAVELDSWRHHRDRDAFERDRRKANALILAGWTVLRFTYADVTRRPAETAATLSAALRRGALSSRTS
jgi:predicted transcriptional regulator of viral defense system